MTNREFDRWLRESMSSLQPEGDPAHWDHLEQRMVEEDRHADAEFDGEIRRALTPLGADLPPDWSRMEQMLEADEHAFDTQVKETIESYGVPYAPETWATLNTKVAEEERLRRRLIHTKILEVAAILIALFTFSNFFPAFRDNMIRPADEEQHRDAPLRSASVVSPVITPSVTSAIDDEQGELVKIDATNVTVHDQRELQASNSIATVGERPALPPVVTAEPAGVVVDNAIANALPVSSEPAVQAESKTGHEDLSKHMLRSGPFVNERTQAQDISRLSGTTPLQVLHRAEPLATAGLKPALTQPGRIRFGMAASADVNVLFFPEERFYSQGRAISFTEKEIIAGGYSAGISMLVDGRKVMLETGLTYSSKTFGPGRKLFIGSSTNSHSLDFENISLDIVSVPLYLHLKIDGTGLWRVYATGGAAMHVIANANFDLIEEIVFSSSAPPQDPHQLQQHAREVQRVRQHILDGAEFSTKGYLTAAAGFGVERFLNSRMSVFAQPMYHYQIPFFGLIDQNGKHIQNGSLLLGTRISL